MKKRNIIIKINKKNEEHATDVECQRRCEIITSKKNVMKNNKIY